MSLQLNAKGAETLVYEILLLRFPNFNRLQQIQQEKSIQEFGFDLASLPFKL